MELGILLHYAEAKNKVVVTLFRQHLLWQDPSVIGVIVYMVHQKIIINKYFFDDQIKIFQSIGKTCTMPTFGNSSFLKILEIM